MDSNGSVLLIGSLPRLPIGEAMTLCAHELGSVLPRLTDGEPGGWVNIPIAALARTEGLETLALPPNAPAYRPPPSRLKDGIVPADLEFAPTGYVDIATRSYAVFEALKADGKIGKRTRFQVSLPTPFATLGLALVEADVPRVLPVYEAHVLREVAAISAAIPHDELAIQWDTAIEVVEVLERHRPDLARVFSDKDCAAHLARLCNAVHEDIELGIHLCYGNPNGKHVIEPTDTRVMVEFVNLLVPKLRRPLTWLHMPVPIERTDAVYFSPLRDMTLPADTQLYLGLVHLGDGVEGARQRTVAAKTVATRFGVATECGMRLIPKEKFLEILDLHRQAARFGA